MSTGTTTTTINNPASPPPPPRWPESVSYRVFLRLKGWTEDRNNFPNGLPSNPSTSTPSWEPWTIYSTCDLRYSTASYIPSNVLSLRDFIQMMLVPTIIQVVQNMDPQRPHRLPFDITLSQAQDTKPTRDQVLYDQILAYTQSQCGQLTSFQPPHSPAIWSPAGLPPTATLASRQQPTPHIYDFRNRIPAIDCVSLSEAVPITVYQMENPIMACLQRSMVESEFDFAHLGTEGSSSTKFPVWAIIVIVIAALVLIVGIVLIVYFIRKRQQKQQMSSSPSILSDSDPAYLEALEKARLRTEKEESQRQSKAKNVVV